MSHETSPQPSTYETPPVGGYPIVDVMPVPAITVVNGTHETPPPEEVEIPQEDLDKLRHGAAVVMKDQFGSLSHLQRKLGIGLVQAQHMMEEFERHDIVGPAPDPNDTDSAAQYRDVLKGESIDEAREVILGITKVSPTYAEALKNNFADTSTSDPLSAGEQITAATEAAKSTTEDLRANPGNQNRKLRGNRPRAKRGKGSGEDTTEQTGEPATPPAVVPAPRTVAPREGSKPAAAEAATAVPTSTPEAAPRTPDNRPATKRTFTDRLKGIFTATKNTPQFIYTKMQVGFSDKDPAAYDERRQNRVVAMRYAVGAAVVAKVAWSGYMAAKGLGVSFGTSFAETAADNMPQGAGQHLESFADTVKGSGHEQIAPEVQPSVEHLDAGDTISDHALNHLHQQGILNPTAAEITQATQKYLDANNLTWDQAKHLPVGFEFKSPDAAPVPASGVEAPVEHLDYSGDSISRHAVDQLHQEGIADPSQKEITEETNRWMTANDMAPDDPRQYHMAVGQDITNPHYVAPVTPHIPLEDTPLHATAHVTHLDGGVVDRELRSTEQVTIGALSAMAVHQAMEDIIKDLREDEEDEAAQKKKKKAKALRR